RPHTTCLSDWSSDVCSSDLSSFVQPGGKAATETSPTKASARTEKLPRACPQSLCSVNFVANFVGKLCRIAPSFDKGCDEGPESRSEERRVGREGRCSVWRGG